jgi:undecaprenyl-diphosphatase
MGEFFQNIDASLFYFINKTCANPLTDKVMPFITESNHWMLVYIILLGWLVIKGGAKGRVAVVMALLLVVVTDQVNSFYIKDLFHRIRPCNALQGVHLLVNCTDSFSFTSSHAINNFGAATIFSYFYKNVRYVLFTVASLVALSRVFAGVHYPFDIIGGALLGILAAWIFIYIWKFISKALKLRF